MTARPSAAVQIVKPPSGPAADAGPGVKTSTGPSQSSGQLNVNATTFGAPAGGSPDKRKDTTQRLCRNVMIYGACRYQGHGCVYYHPPPGTDPAFQPPAQAETTTPTLKDQKGLSEIGAEHLSAPVFVPKTPMTEAPSPSVSAPSVSAPSEQEQWPTMPPAGLLDTSGTVSSHGGFESSFSMGGTTMDSSGVFMAHQPVRQPLDYHLYTAPLPHITNPSLSSHPLHSFFIPDDLRRTLTSRHEATYATPSAPTGLPNELGVYHNLVPLGAPPGQGPGQGSRVWGHPAPIYKATSSVDGNVYALRRIEGYKLVNEQAFGALDTWRRMRHPNIVGLREAFTTKAFNDNSLIVVYDYHPDSTTVWDEHVNQNADPSAIGPNGKRRQGMPIPERQLWSYITQVANALKAIHTSGLAARALDPSKILITGKNRVRINGCGILDVLAHDASTPVSVYQQEDLVSLGKLILIMACEFFQVGLHPAGPLDHIARHYSPDVKNLVLFCLSKPNPGKNVDEVIKMIGPRILNELDAMQNYVDVLESDLGSELENGRIARLLIKLGFINERAEFELDPRWSDTGDRYILKLFRDYVFHSISVDGSPILDLSHVLTCLNKLDTGLDERIMLVSRDDQSCLVVSYREIKNCIEAAYSELRNAGGPRRMR
ncbi:poly(A)-specific ribonuclease [Papiliotrema laurentii]|uniref:PAN2-PAN3 deadenylation complex subunit PAN3 n=1 Tax=Papiliotrema laurentii TaxID=5418 RepID=A0AAD9FJM2_PAPLA|nr:poly(A)-specific ribonuclease [Papiliotrema laurentii]